ncbi:MAG: DNA/RNA non-specific endonuclease [Desulfarculaceae bacterium]|nr:DNA/RNA non-specific endonuclease [Desulfarculaceae bacterium]
MQSLRSLCLALVLSCLLLACGTATAATLKPIVLDSSYNHTKYAPKCGEGDILRQFGAYTTCFDGPDDDDGDGVPDKWAIPHWVAYEIKRYDGVLGKGPRRPGEWITDQDLFAQGIVPSDASYKFSKEFREANPDSPQLGYDRGHMCMKQHAWRLGANADWNTHTVLNAVPQKSDLNQGIWLDLEKMTAEWADRYVAVWVITGPIVYNRKPTQWLGELGEVPVAIPEAFFKVVIREEPDGNLKILAFIYPQGGIGYKQSGGYDHRPYLTSVDVIEALTGLDIMPVIQDDEQNRIESVVQIRLWE